MPDRFFIKNECYLLQMEYSKVATDATVLFRLCKFTEKHIACQYRNIAPYSTPRSPWSSLLHPRNQKFFFRFNKIIHESFDYYQRRSIIRTPQSVLIKLWEIILTCRSKILYNILFEDKTLVTISGNSDCSDAVDHSDHRDLVCVVFNIQNAFISFASY